jgi:2'-5' RNA ligase
VTQAPSNETLRLFWAVVPPLAVRQALSAALDQAAGAGLLSGVRALHADNLHFTLHFVGSTPAQRVCELEAAGKQVAARCSAFALSVHGVGAFPKAQHAKIVWLGASAGADQLVSLAQEISAADAQLGFPVEARAFVPHLTLGRLAVPRDVRALLGALVLPAALSFEVQALSLMRSQLGEGGARYQELARLPLRVAQAAPPA